MIRASAVGSFVIALTSFAWAAGGQPLLVPQDGVDPEVGLEVEVEIGEAILTEYHGVLQRVAVLDSPSKLWEAGTVLYGELPEKSTRPPWFCGEGKIGLVCYQDRDQDGAFETLQRNRSSAKFKVKGNPKYHLDLRPSDPSLQTPDYLRREVVYQGAGGNVLRLLYREYLGDLARPAFSQELTFDIEEEGPTLVAVKGARIEVLEAGNLGIRYRVLKDFQD